MKTKIRTLGLLSILVIVMISGCIDQESKPEPEIQYIDCEKTLNGLNWVVRQQIVVKNIGDPGEISIEGTFDRFSETSTIYFQKGETRRVYFEYDCTYWDHGRCTARVYVKE